MPDPNATQSLQALPSQPQAIFGWDLDGRLITWALSHQEDFKQIVALIRKILGDLPRGQELRQAIQQATPEQQEELRQALGERLGGLGGILQKLPQLIALIEKIMAVWPQIQVLIDTISKLFPATPATPVGGPATGGVVNPGFITQE